ncbi:trifunctional purine biosynthetic protein adenosine-3-like [Anomaloglossus baeobatrachus]|uniref:trifunctional purine biosynthetic protein adenosine-3-like n=1 Tax=Anomaloglossus baeobatrachus TaxID=238106 RepID=UPI003F4FEEC9
MTDRVLVIGCGEAEESLCWAVAQSAHVKQVLCAPGTEGMADSRKIAKSAVITSNPAILKQFCKEHNINLVIISSVSLLAAGLTDDLTKFGVRCFGPTMKAAQLQDNKKMAKDFMERLDIPTARWKSFTNPHKACSFITYADFPALVVKAVMFSSGRDVYITRNKDEACRAVQQLTQGIFWKRQGPMMSGQKTLQNQHITGRLFHGGLDQKEELQKANICFKIINYLAQDWILGASTTLVVEERLEGKEYICLAVTDGVSLVPLPFVHISKHCISEAASPGIIQMSEKHSKKVQDKVLQKAIDAMKQEGWHYKGLFGAKIMMTGKGPIVLGFICSFQDLKTQVIAPLLKPDLYEVIQAAIEERLSSYVVTWSLEKCVGNTATTMREMWSPVDVAKTKQSDPDEGGGNDKMARGETVSTGATAAAPIVGTKCNKIVGFPGMAYKKNDPSAPQKRKERHKLHCADDSNAKKNPTSDAAQSGPTEMGNVHQSFRRKVRYFDINTAQYKDPVFVCSSTSIGDKIEVARACNLHRTAAQSLVTTCINDILAQGAQTVFFLPHCACGQLPADVTEALEEGLAQGCRITGATLLGEMIMDSTMVFTPPILRALQSGDISACVPITDGGLVGSIVHYLPAHMSVIIDALCWKIPAIVPWLYEAGELSEQDLVCNFTCGIGAVLIAHKNVAQKILAEIQKDEEAWMIGSILHHRADSPRVQIRHFLEALKLNNFQLLKNVILYKAPAKISKVAVLISSAEFCSIYHKC